MLSIKWTTKKDVSQPVFTLASVSYGSSDKRALVPTLLAFATIPEIRNLDHPPEFTPCDLSDGFVPSRFPLRNTPTTHDNAGRRYRQIEVQQYPLALVRIDARLVEFKR
jgi:hypothetical protein